MKSSRVENLHLQETMMLKEQKVHDEYRISKPRYHFFSYDVRLCTASGLKVIGPCDNEKVLILPLSELLLELPPLVCALCGACSWGCGCGLDGVLIAISYVGSPSLVSGGVTTGVRTAVL